GGRQGGVGGKVVIAASGDLTLGPAPVSASAADGGDIILSAGERSDAAQGIGGALTIGNGTQMVAEALLVTGVGGSIALDGCDVTIEPTADLHVNGGERSEGVEITARERLTVSPLVQISALPDGAITLAYRRQVTLASDASIQPPPLVVQDPTLASCPACGNETVDGVEECDGQGRASCPQPNEVCLQPDDPDPCTCAATCGTMPGIQPGEKCDGADLGGASCVSLKFLGGTLACSSDCQFDTSGCTQDMCGDGVVGPSEACDPGNGTPPNFDGKTCESLGFPLGGTLTCAPDCSAIITVPHCSATVVIGCGRDADCPGGETCVGACRACGNGFVDPGEECDEGAGNRSAANHCREDCR